MIMKVFNLKAFCYTCTMATAAHSVSVAGAVYDTSSDSFLVIQRRDNNEWQLPGGVLELDEKIEDGVIREVLEETGVIVRTLKLTGVYKNMSKGVVALVFLCEAVSGEPTTSNESKNVAWMPSSRLQEMMSEAFSVRLLDAINTETPYVRSNDGVNLV